MVSKSANPLIRLQLPWAYKRRRPYSGRGERGYALFETALCAVLLLTVLFAVIELTLAIYTYHYISEAAREGTRYASVHGSGWSTTAANYCGAVGVCNCPDASTEYCTASSANIQSYVKNFGGPQAVTVNVTCGTIGGTLGTCSSSNNNPGNVVQVNVQYKFSFALPLLTFPITTLSSTSQMVIAQ